MTAAASSARTWTSWLAAVAVPSAICTVTVIWFDRFMGIGGESALFVIGVLVVALLGGIAPAALSALWSGMLLNYFLTEPRYSFRIAEPVSAVTIVVLLAVAVAVSALVEIATKRARDASEAEAITKADEYRRALLSAVSHDLRTPLAAAKAAVSSLRSEDVVFSAEDTAELLAAVEESIDQLTDLVGNLLDSSRLAAGVIRPQVRSVYLDEVIHRALLALSHKADMNRIQIDADDVAAMADPGLMERVLANIVDNSLRYAPSGTVRVSARPIGDRVLVEVADVGPGILSGTEQRMFEPFQQLGDTDNSTGVGLGLSVAKGFTEAMGGTISSAPTAGGGLTITVNLAASKEEPSP